jgi:UDP-N-acetylmuramoyl-L-alanyl-D-glutamate--2,6-diaminopimelate ligase
MNRINEGQNFEVIVDYAHTPDALEKVFKATGGAKGRVISVHGGAGRRDETTRSERGEILAKNSDIVIITEDDSRDERPRKIANQFVEGAEDAGKTLKKDLFVELDREEAIKMAIKMAKEGDVVLLLGKGHEKTILRKDGAHDFEDAKVARKYIKERVKELEEKKKAEEKARKLKEEAKKKEAARRKREEEKYGNIVP